MAAFSGFRGAKSSFSMNSLQYGVDYDLLGSAFGRRRNNPKLKGGEKKCFQNTSILPSMN